MSFEGLVRHFSVVEDPRCQGKIDHRLIDILVIAVCAVIACAESWDDIALYGRSKLAWLRTFLDLPRSMPWMPEDAKDILRLIRRRSTPFSGAYS